VHALETGLYMKNQLLRDADWAAMAHSVELRVPLVDATLRAALAARGFEPARRLGKAGVVAAVAPELPPQVLRRPKTGFYAPVAEWLARDGAPLPASRGQGSRRLAAAVLRAFGVELRA
jgi:asparagine synthase (glutamine-hydrolysing)